MNNFKRGLMRVSVIIPAYNAAAYIERALRSVFNQTRAADEIIVVNDGSTDETPEILLRYADKIRVIHQRNAGLSAARNAGIRAACGDWIGLLDADDEWLPEKLNMQEKVIQRNPDLSWMTGNCYLREDGKSQKPILTEQQQACVRAQMKGKEYFESYIDAYRLHAIGNCDTMMIRKDKLLEAGLFSEGQQIEDEEMWLRLAYLNLKVGFVFEPLAVYYTHIQGSITQRLLPADHVIFLLSKHRALSQKAGKISLFRFCGRTILGHWINRYLTAEQGPPVRELLRTHGDLLSTYGRWTAYAGSWCPKLWRWNERRKHPEMK
jgi:glycosyltransferase involved in cell wall biosynthesis